MNFEVECSIIECTNGFIDNLEFDVEVVIKIPKLRLTKTFLISEGLDDSISDLNLCDETMGLLSSNINKSVWETINQISVVNIKKTFVF